MKRKILSLILVFAMTVSLVHGRHRSGRTDLRRHRRSLGRSSIERWSACGIIQGSNGQFDPNGQLTCAQLATILAKLLKLPAAKDAGFIDKLLAMPGTMMPSTLPRGGRHPQRQRRRHR